MTSLRAGAVRWLQEEAHPLDGVFDVGDPVPGLSDLLQPAEQARNERQVKTSSRRLNIWSYR